MTLMVKLLPLLLFTVIIKGTHPFSVSTSQSKPITISQQQIKNLPNTPSNKESSELLLLLQNKQEQQANSSKDENNSSKRIEDLVYSLISSKSSFNPQTSINGPFYASVYIIGEKTPLWEKIGLGKANIKGQQYSIGNNDSSNNDDNVVINYSEILGKNINLQARGTFEPSASTPTTNDDVDNDDTDTSSSSSSLFSVGELFKSILPSSSSSSSTNNNNNNLLLTCPYDYDVTVSSASINIIGLPSINIPIKGYGCTRVLYADECLRIFESPTDTQVTSGGVGNNDWESAGLIVVQVRIDLINKNIKKSSPFVLA